MKEWKRWRWRKVYWRLWKLGIGKRLSSYFHLCSVGCSVSGTKTRCLLIWVGLDIGDGVCGSHLLLWKGFGLDNKNCWVRLRVLCVTGMAKYLVCLIGKLKLTFTVFKQFYTFFYKQYYLNSSIKQAFNLVLMCPSFFFLFF